MMDPSYDEPTSSHTGHESDSTDQLSEHPPTQAFAPTAFKGLPTTLMIRNIPPQYTRGALALEWPNINYDFFYLPCSSNIHRNKGYAFINFTSHGAAQGFLQQWNKMRLSQFTAGRALNKLNICWAAVQGRDENLLQLKKQDWRLKAKLCQPLVFHNGSHISLKEAFNVLKEKPENAAAGDG